jgi:hypothetical protein
MGGRLLLQRGGHPVVPAGRPAEAEREPRGLAEWTPRLSSPDGWPTGVPGGVSRIVRTPNQAGVQWR